jgi:hypothetical protein
MKDKGKVVYPEPRGLGSESGVSMCADCNHHQYKHFNGAGRCEAEVVEDTGVVGASVKRKPCPCLKMRKK